MNGDSTKSRNPAIPNAGGVNMGRPVRQPLPAPVMPPATMNSPAAPAALSSPPQVQQQTAVAVPGGRGMPVLKAMKKGGAVGSASKRADGIAQRGKTRGKVL